MEEFSDIVLAYGHSDEFSFVLRPTCSLYERRARCGGRGGSVGSSAEPAQQAHVRLRLALRLKLRDAVERADGERDGAAQRARL